MANKLFTSIKTGLLKGRRIELPSLDTTRSTKSIVKGSFFDTYRYELANKVFIECFAGSGAMACEALSNGADSCYGIEKDIDAFKVLSRNFYNISEKLFAKNGDCFKILPDILENIQLQAIVYLDPPFEIRDGFDDIYEKVTKLIESISKYNIALICIEHMSNVAFNEQIGKFKLSKSRKFGNTTLSYYSK